MSPHSVLTPDCPPPTATLDAQCGACTLNEMPTRRQAFKEYVCGERSTGLGQDLREMGQSQGDLSWEGLEHMSWLC